MNGPNGPPSSIVMGFFRCIIVHALCSLVLEGLRSVVHASGICGFCIVVDALREVRVLELRRMFSGLLAVV